MIESPWKKQEQEGDRRQFKKEREKKKEGRKGERTEWAGYSLASCFTSGPGGTTSEKEKGRRVDFVVQVKPSACQNSSRNERSVSLPPR